MSERLDGDQELIRRFLAETKSTGFGVPKVYGAGDDARWGLTAYYVGPVEKDDSGGRRAVISNEADDRHGDTLKASGCDYKHFRKNPVMLFGHRHDIPAVGKWKNVTKGGGEVTGEPVFAPTALGQELAELYDGGFMSAWSVGFIPVKWKPKKGKGEDVEADTGGYDITKWELLETSAVNVPANPEALSKALQMGTEDAIRQALVDWRKTLEAEGEVDPNAVTQEMPAPEPTVAKFLCRKCGEPIYEIDDECWQCGEPIDTLKAEKYNCECIDCGHKLKSEKHCKDIKCPKCGGEMRRAERPGPGRSATIEATYTIENGITEADIDSMSQYADECERAAESLARLKQLHDEIEGEGGSANAERAPRTERPAPRKLDEAKVVEAVLKSIPGVIDAALARHKGRLTDEDLS